LIGGGAKGGVKVDHLAKECPGPFFIESVG
jgi:hypothetical protein